MILSSNIISLDLLWIMSINVSASHAPLRISKRLPLHLDGPVSLKEKWRPTWEVMYVTFIGITGVNSRLIHTVSLPSYEMIALKWIWFMSVWRKRERDWERCSPEASQVKSALYRQLLYLLYSSTSTVCVSGKLCRFCKLHQIWYMKYIIYTHTHSTYETIINLQT